jgi:hypothetical protein
MYKYGITPQELKEARKLIIQDIRSNNKVVKPIENMTLQTYFDIIKECMLGATDGNGVVVDPWGNTWWSENKKIDIRNVSSIEVAKAWMDGRGLFTQHFNGNKYKAQKDYGIWDNISDHDQNQWYHEDRLGDVNWFKQCTQCSIGVGGHPCECLGAGSIYPVMYEEDKWFIEFGMFSRSDYYALKAYLRLKKLGIPAFISNAKMYLTNKQITKLQEEGCLVKEAGLLQYKTKGL